MIEPQPPPVIEESIPDQEPQEAPEPRDSRAWTLLACILAALCFISLSNSVLAPVSKRAEKPSPYQGLLEQETSVRVLADRFQEIGGSSDQAEQLRKEAAEPLTDSISDLVEPSKKDAESSRWYAAMRTEQGKPVPDENLAPLRKSASDSDRAVAEIYGSKKLTKNQADSLLKRIGTTSFLDKITGVQALEKSGDKKARSKVFDWRLSVGRIVAALIVSFIFVAGGFVWMAYTRAKAMGRIVPAGFPLGPINAATADRLAWRACQILLGFVLISLAISILEAIGVLVSGQLGIILEGLAIVTVLPVLATVPVQDKLLSLRSVGLHTDDFWKNVLWGIGGFLAEFPVSMVMASLGMVIFSFLPAPTHPAEQQLVAAKSLGDVVPILLFGSITAPIWEEFVFRGLIFPGLARITGRIPLSAVMTGLMFAMIHPQGLALWLALATVGTMGCALTYQRKSLVPTIVMHMLHNITIFTVVLLAMGKY